MKWTDQRPTPNAPQPPSRQIQPEPALVAWIRAVNDKAV